MKFAKQKPVMAFPRACSPGWEVLEDTVGLTAAVDLNATAPSASWLLAACTSRRQRARHSALTYLPDAPQRRPPPLKARTSASS